MGKHPRADRGHRSDLVSVLYYTAVTARHTTCVPVLRFLNKTAVSIARVCVHNREWWRGLIKKYTWEEFSRRCKEGGIAHGPVLSQSEVLVDAQVKHNKILDCTPATWGCRLPRPAPEFEATPSSFRLAPAQIGAHNADYCLPPV